MLGQALPVHQTLAPQGGGGGGWARVELEMTAHHEYWLATGGDETYRDVIRLGNNIRGRIVRDLTILGGNVRGRIVPVPVSSLHNRKQLSC